MRIRTVKDFFKHFPDEEVCLNYMMKIRFGGPWLRCRKCRRWGKFTLLSDRPAFCCPACGHHLHPMKGTPYAFSHIPLQKWFYALYLISISNGRVSAKELERQLGVTYKSAWRMKKQFMKYMRFR
jgi:transposase